MKTSRVKAYYQDYMRSVSNHGYGYSVISYNTSIFTCGYLFNRDGELWFAVHTPSYYGEMKVEED